MGIRFFPITFFVLAACSDVTSDVGLGLLEENAGPELIHAQPSVFEAIPHRDVTGAQNRVLTGHVMDPQAGTVRAIGYANFSAADGTSISGDVTVAGLRLVVDYLYGDSLQTMSIGLHDILASWEAPGGRADTSLSFGAEITQVSFAPTDTVITIQMPDNWVDQHRDALGSLDFDSGIHGIAFVGVSRTGVVGFTSTRSILYVKTETDSVALDMSKTISGISRLDEPLLQDDLVLLQDGSGPSIRIDFDLAQFRGRPLNGATVRFPFETIVAPDNFVRPNAPELQLVMVTDPAEPVIVIADLLRVNDNEYRGSEASLGAFMQDVFFENVEYEWLEIRIPVSNNTINSVLMRSANVGAPSPEALFVFSR